LISSVTDMHAGSYDGFFTSAHIYTIDGVTVRIGGRPWTPCATQLLGLFQGACYFNHFRVFRMQSIYAQIQEGAMEIAARYPLPDFYKDFASENQLSRHLLETDATVAEIRRFVGQRIEDDFGHGMEHAVKVALDAGTLTVVEGKISGFSGDTTHRRVVLAQCAGLFHDIKRKRKDHAREGSNYAREVFSGCAFADDEVNDIALAIASHEAFKDPMPIESVNGEILSNCLYDADKFRWGPDNFTHTLWQMVASYNPPLSRFVARYWKGMEGVARIKHTFRTVTGKTYGPQFIEIGLAMGKDIFTMIREAYSMYL
jgi:hypothetical protein